MICPASMKITRFATCRAKPISWLTTSMVMPSWASATIVSSTSLTISGSSAEVGSSNSMIFGPMHSARAADLVDLLEIVGELDAIDHDAALLVLLEPIDAADHGGFAGSGRPANDDALAALYPEVYVAQNVEVAVPLVHCDDIHGDLVGRCLHLRPGGPRFPRLGRLHGLGHHRLRSAGQRRSLLARRASVYLA